MMFKKRVKPYPQTNAKRMRAEAWSASDRAALQRAIDPLHSSFRLQPFGFLQAEVTTLICAPENEVYDRLTSLLSNCSIVSGLVLSAIASAALEPLEISTFPVEKQQIAEIFNVLAALTVISQLLVVLYSTFTLYIVIAAAHNPIAVYRFLVHSVRWVGFFEFMTFLPALGSFALIVLATHLYNSLLATKIVAGCTIGLFVGFQSFFCCVMCHGLPYNAWAWASMAAPPLFGSKWLRKKAVWHGELLLAQAGEGVLAGLDENDDLIIDDQSDQDAVREWDALDGLVKSSSIKMSQTRVDLVVKELKAAGLTRKRMVEAAQLPSGFQVLTNLLATQSGLGLRPGERLALATAAMQCEPASGDGVRPFEQCSEREENRQINSTLESMNRSHL